MKIKRLKMGWLAGRGSMDYHRAMEINLLVLNLGNSRLGSGLFVGGELTLPQRVSHEQRSDWEGVLRQSWAKIATRENAAVAAASVNPALEAELETAVEKATGKKIAWVGKDLDLPIHVATDKPAETGVDRVLNVAAAYEQMQKACCVVDAGSAITVDVCDDKGEFLGGAIFPGINMMLDALHQQTARLPRIDFAPPADVIGRNTQEAIRLGLYAGVRGMVKEVVEGFAMHLNNWPDLIATGGDSPALFGDWELVHAVSPDLTLFGIALAYANHHIKHGT